MSVWPCLLFFCLSLFYWQSFFLLSGICQYLWLTANILYKQVSNSANSFFPLSVAVAPQINKSNHFFNYLHVLLPATALCTSRGAFLLCGLWAHGDRQASLWQVRTGAVSAHPVHFGKEVSTHVLAGTVDIHTPISSVGLFLLSLVLPLGLFWKPEIMRLLALFKNTFSPFGSCELVMSLTYEAWSLSTDLQGLSEVLFLSSISRIIFCSVIFPCCPQVFVTSSAKQNDLGQPFGYLKASTTLTCVNLFVMPYNYPVLLPLLGKTYGSKLFL